MVSTFISLLDIQSWWEIPCIAHFCSLFSSAFDLPDIDIEDLESALLTDGTEDSVGLLPELIVRILRGCDLLKSNRDEITTSNYQMFLRRFLRHQCRENNVKNYFDTDTDFSSLPVRNKLLILHSLCHFRLESADVCYKFSNLEADSLRVEPLGFDSKNSGYWYFFGTRLYREDTKVNSKDTIWQVICFTEEDWQNLAAKLKICKSKKERALLKILEENFLPKLSQLFLERERLRRKKLFQNRNSARIRAADIKYRDLYEKQDLERIEREKYEEQLKLAEVTNKKRRRSQSESTGSGISTYASSIRPSLNSSDFLCKREKFCLSPDFGTSLSPPPASLIQHTPLFPPTPSQSPPPVKSLKIFNNLNEVDSEQNRDLEKKSNIKITDIEDIVIESKIFSQINRNNSIISNLDSITNKKISFTPDSHSQLDVKSSFSSNCSDHSDDYDDAISLVSFDEDKENLICYKRSDTESDTESNSYHCKSPSYFNSSNLRIPITSKLLSEEKLYNMAPITNSAAIKLPGRQTNNSLSSISENIFLPTFDNNAGTKKSAKNGKSGKKDTKETKNKNLKTEMLEKSGKKIKTPPNEKLDKKIERKESVDVDNSHKKKKSKNSDSQNKCSLKKAQPQILPQPKMLPPPAITSYLSIPNSNSYINSTNNSFLSFTETDEVLQIGMHKVLVYVKNHRDAWPFMDPVEEDIAPRYYSIIRRPMDLLKMEDKLDNGEYKKFSEFRNDFKLIVNNCRLYNGQNNEYTEMVNNLQEAFDKATKKYFDNLSDEEDELGYPDSKLNVFREKYFNKANADNDDAIEDICSSEIINQSKENEQSENFSIKTDEDDNKIECKGKTTKRKRKDKDKRRKKKMKLGSEKSVQNDDTEDDEEIENIDNPTLEDEKVIFKNSISDLSEDYEINIKNKKSKQLMDTEKSKKKSDNKLKDRDKSKKTKDEHKSKSKNCEKDKEISGKKHTKKGHSKIKNHKSSKEILQQSHEESDAEPTDNENLKDISKDNEQELEDENNEDIYDFDSNNSSDEDFDLELKTKNRNEINKKTEKVSKNKKVKETQKKIKEKGKSLKMSTNISESRNKKKNNSKIKKDKVYKKVYSDQITSNSEDSDLELKIEKTEIDKSKETLYSDSSRSPTPNFKVDLHKKYANTLTPTKSASLERNFSNDVNDNENEGIGGNIIGQNNEENKHKPDCDDKKTKKHSKRNDQKRKKDIPKTSITKIDNSDENDEVDIDANKKKLNFKSKSITQLSAKSKKSISKKSKKKVNKILEAKSLTKNEKLDDEIFESTSNLNQSGRSRSQTPSSPDINEKHNSFKHKSKNIGNLTEQISEIKKKKNHKVKSKNKKQVVTDTEDNSSDKDDKDPEPEKNMMADIPLFLDKYDLIKQRRRSAALNLKKTDEKNKRSNKQIGKNKSKKNLNKNKISIKDKEKNQKHKDSTEKLKGKNEKIKERIISVEETQSSKTASQDLRDEKSVSEKSHETYPNKSPTKFPERTIKKTQSESGKIKESKHISTETKDLKNKTSKPKEIKALKKREICNLDIKITENIDEIIPNIIGSPTQNKKINSKKQQQILDSISTSLSNTTNLIKKKGKNALGITPPVAIVAPTQSLTNTSLIKSESNTNKTTNMEALELETEQTLKDINRWLEHTPRFSEFSSASNSPNRYNLLDDFDAVAAKLDPADFRRPIDTINTINASAINGSTTSSAKVDADPKLAETFNDIKKSSDKLITDLIPVVPASNKLGLLSVKDSDSNSAGTTGTGTTGGANSSPSITSSGGSLLQINVKPKEPNTTQLLPHPPPLPPHIKNQLQKKNKSLKKLAGISRRKDLLGPIDRLQPGKSKGNLLANVHNTNKPEELFPLGAVTKVKEIKNSLVVETDESAPKLSLGSVLNTSGFGLGQLHNFGDEIASGEFKIKEAITSDENENNKKDDLLHEKSENDDKKGESISEEKCVEEVTKEEVNPFQLKKEDIQAKNEVKSEDLKTGSATPNLSAWFKAFGAPKKTKKQEEEDEKKKLESLESGNNIQNTDSSPTCSTKNVKSPAQTGHENFSLPAPRQRKASTGSTVSERSSYSQDPDSPRIGIDDRFGPYPGPYASPIGASPIMVSPKADEITKPTSPYPLNGTIKVGFYQDTTTKSSPEKSCSPRELPSPAYPQYSQHIYSATSPNVNVGTDIVSPGTTPYGAGSSQVNNSIAGASSTFNANNEQKKTPSSSGFSPRSPVQPPTPTLYEQYKQPHSQESDYNSSMSPSTNPNSPYQQPQSSPYQQHTSSSPYHQSSNPNSPYQQPHSPFSNHQGQSGQGPPSSGPPSVGSMHIVTNSPNHPNGESPRGQNSPYQQQLNSPYQHSGHSSPYNQNQSASSPFHQSSSPAHVSASGQSQPPLQSNSQKTSSFVQPPIINMETASSVLEKHQIKLQKAENDNSYDTKQNYSDEKNSKSIVNQNNDVLKQSSKPQSSAPLVQQNNLPQGLSNVSQSQQSSGQPQPQLQSLKQTQQHSSQLLQTQQYHSANQSQILNHTQGSRNSFESNNTLLANSSLNQTTSQISNLQSNQEADLTSGVVEKTNLNLQQQYSRYPQYPISSNSEKGNEQRTAFVNDLSQQLVTKQNPMNMTNTQQQTTQHQSQKHSTQQQLHQNLQQPMHQNIQQSPQHALPQHSQQQLQQQSISMKRNYSNEAASTSMNVNYSQQNVVANEVKNSKGDEKMQQHQPQSLQQHQPQQQQIQQHQPQQQSQLQQQPLYDPATLNKHHQMFDGFLNSMAASKNIGFNKPLDITSNKAYEVLNKAAAIGFPNHLMQAAAAAVMSNKDSLQQHQTNLTGHTNQQQKTENLTNLYSQTLTQISNTNRMTLPPQSQQHQTQHQQTQQQQHQQQPASQTQPQQAAHNQQSTATPLYGGSKNGQGNMSTVNTTYSTPNSNQRNDNPAELMSNANNRNLDLSNYKAPPSNYQNSSNIIDHTMRHHTTLTQMIDDSTLLGLQNNTSSGIGNIPLTNYYDKSMPPAAHMFSKNLSQQLYQNSSTIYGGRDQQNLPPPGNYVPQNNQNPNSNISNINAQVEQQISSSTSSVEQKQNKRSKKKKGIEATNLNQNSINMVGNNQHTSSTSIQLPQTQQHQAQEQQQMLSNTQNPSNTSNSNNISPNITAAHQGFQLYAGLKTAAAVVAASSSANQAISSGSSNSSTDSSAISLKTTAAAAAASMVPGSAFNFGPSPTGLPIPGGLYGDNSTYLEEFRTANPYYIPPTHHRVASESSSNNPIQSSVTDKSQTPSINSNSTSTVAAAAAAAASPYHQFLTAAAAHPAAQRSTYPFMNSPQLDPNSPLYTQYLRTDELRARMMQNLSQSLLPGAAAAGYPQTGYRPTLGMPKPYDINNRQTWF